MAPRDADRPIRLRLEHTRYGHWGGRSGYPAFAAHLNPGRCDTQIHASPDNHDEIARWLRPLKPWLKPALQRRRMRWYKVSDLEAELVCLVQSLAGRLDIVHFLDGEHGGQFLPGSLRALGSKTRTMATFHQPPDLLEEILDTRVLPHLDHIVLMSPSQRAFFERHVPGEKISVLLHGVDIAFFHPAKPGPEPTTSDSARRIRCVTVGHWLRDWSIFALVAQRLPSIDFHVVTARETGADHLGNVHRHTGIADDELASLYRSADILFLPLLDATANNALLEGVASGLPTITTDLEAVRAYLPNEEALLIPPGDGERAVGALEQLAADPALRVQLGAAARRRAEELSLTRVAAQYEALYGKVLGRSAILSEHGSGIIDIEGGPATRVDA